MNILPSAGVLPVSGVLGINSGAYFEFVSVFFKPDWLAGVVILAHLPTRYTHAVFSLIL